MNKFAPSLTDLTVVQPTKKEVKQMATKKTAKPKAEKPEEGKPQASPAPEHEPYSYYRAHPEKAREIGKRWRAKNPDKVREYGRRYRERQRTASPPPEADKPKRAKKPAAKKSTAKKSERKTQRQPGIKA